LYRIKVNRNEFLNLNKLLDKPSQNSPVRFPNPVSYSRQSR